MSIRRVTPDTLVPEVSRWLDNVNDDLNDLVRNAVQLGETTVKQYIATRGTAKSGKPWRIDTGRMYQSVRGKTLGMGPARKEGVFGLGEGPDYSLFQEKGFKHNRSGAHVEGMFAVVDAYDVVLQQVKADLSRVGR